MTASSANAQSDGACRQKHFSRFSEWSEAVNLGPVVNSDTLEFWPAISPNGLSLYFGSNRPGGIPGADLQDIWVSQRASLDAPWGEPRNLGPNVNTEFRDNSPRLSRDGHWLIFGSARPSGKCVANSTNEFYISHRENTEDDFAWEPAVNFGCEISAAGANTGSTFFHDDDKGITTLYFGSNRNGGTVDSYDIYASTRGFHGTFGPPTLVTELSSSLIDLSPWVRPDGLEMFLKWSGRNMPIRGDLSVATRETISQPWTTPTVLGPMVNSAFDNDMPTLSCDGTTLFFVSNRPGGSGNYDIYVTTRRPLEEPELVLLSASQNSRQGEILHAGTSQVASSNNPAVIGEVVEVYCTGLSGGSSIPPRITIGNKETEILFVAKARPDGVSQVKVRVPDIAPGLHVPVRLSYLGRLSNEVTIGVR